MPRPNTAPGEHPIVYLNPITSTRDKPSSISRATAFICPGLLPSMSSCARRIDPEPTSSLAGIHQILNILRLNGNGRHEVNITILANHIIVL